MSFATAPAPGDFAARLTGLPDLADLRNHGVHVALHDGVRRSPCLEVHLGDRARPAPGFAVRRLGGFPGLVVRSDGGEESLHQPAVPGREERIDFARRFDGVDLLLEIAAEAIGRLR